MNEKKSLKMMEAIMEQMSLKTGPSKSSYDLDEPVINKQYSSPKKKGILRSDEYHTISEEVYSPENKRRIKELLSSSSNFEIEASFGIFKGNSFQPGLKSLSQFNNLRKHLDKMTTTQGGSLYLRTYSNRIDKIKTSYVRRIVDKSSSDSISQESLVAYEKKDRFTDQIIDNIKWGIRISKSREEFVDDSEFDEKRWNEIENLMKNPISTTEQKKLEDIAIQRIRNRRSYTESNTQSKLHGTKFDLTTVNEVHIRENGTTYNIIKHEVEIERIKESVSLDGFLHAIFYVIQHYQNATEQKQVIDQVETRIAVSLHNKLFTEDFSYKKWHSTDLYKIFGDYWNKPRNVKLKYMMEKDFSPCVTIKFNGIRYSLLFSSNGVYIYNPPYDLTKIGPRNEKLDGTLIDCEVMPNYNDSPPDIYAFDILFFKGKDLRKLDFKKRIEILESIPQNIEKLYGVEYHTKVFYQEGTFYDRVKEAFEEIDKNKIYEKYNLVDGLIFQPYGHYKNTHTYKWKKEEDLTIDFLFELMELDQIINMTDISPDQAEQYVGKVFLLMMGSKSGNIIFEGSSKHSYKGYVILESDSFDGQYLGHKIVECYWDKENKNFLPRLVRDDKSNPNYETTVLSVWEDIMNPIPRATIEGDSLQFMRKYHNNKKLSLLSKEISKDSIIIDIGSGRGGDIAKWGKVGVKKVYAIEPNPENLKEFKKRHKESKYKTNIETMNHGAEKTYTISDILEKHGDLEILDGIVSFASLTFFPKERTMYDNLLKTIDLLPQGGKFIGFVFDGEKVRELLETSRQKEGIEDDEVAEYITGAYTIRQVTEIDDNIIGNEIQVDITDPTSMVKTQTEWLFYFTPFKQSLENMGFELIQTYFLDGGSMYDVLPESSKVFSKLNRVFIFQRISSGIDSSIKRLPKDEKDVLFEHPKVDNAKLLPKNSYGNNLYYVGTHQDPSSFIHAVLRATSPEYYKMNERKRLEYVAKIRKVLAKKLTLKMFKTLHNGELVKCLQEPYLEDSSQKDAIKRAYLEFKLNLINTDEWAGENFFLELTSIVLGVNIYVLTLQKGREQLLQVSNKFSKICDKLYTNDKSVVLVTFDDKYYYVVSRESSGNMVHIHDSSSEFIQSLFKEICP